MDKYMIVYLSKALLEGPIMVIHPSKQFNRDWKGLADSMTDGYNFGFTIR